MAPEEKKLVSEIRHAVHPWNSVYAHTNGDVRRERVASNQEEIDICLGCPLAECTDCYRYKKYRFSYLAHLENLEALRKETQE